MKRIVASSKALNSRAESPPRGRSPDFISAELPGSDVASDDEIEAYFRENGGCVSHQVGTCKMGNDSMAVVDDRLLVHGLQGLRVADASIMPTLISGNMNAATIMIREKACAMISADS